MVKDTVRILRPKHVRTRLTLWYVFVLAGVLALSWAVTASFLFLQMRGQLDNYAVQDIETVEGLLNFDASGHLNLREDYHNHPESKEVLERLVEVRSSNGTVLYRNERLGDQPLGGNLIPGEGEGGYSIRAARLVDGTTVRMASRRHTLEGRPIVIRLGYSEQPIWARFEELAVATLLAVPIVLALAGLGGYLLAKRALAPLEQMTNRAEEITSERLHERLPTGEVDDELGHLARVFNNLLARLEQSFEQLRRFTAVTCGDNRIPICHHPEIAVERIDRTQDKGRRPSTGQRCGNFFADLTGFSNPDNDDLSTGLYGCKQQLDRLLESFVQPIRQSLQLGNLNL